MFYLFNVALYLKTISEQRLKDGRSRSDDVISVTSPVERNIGLYASENLSGDASRLHESNLLLGG